MRSLASRASRWAVAVGAIAIVVTSCSSPGSTAKPAKPRPSISAPQAIALAVQDLSGWKSDISTFTDVGIEDGTRISYAYVFRDDDDLSFHEMTVTSYQRGGKDVMPGGSDDVVAPTVDYVRQAELSRYYHTAKPWVELTEATLDSIGAKVHSSIPARPGAFFGNAVYGPQFLTASTDVRAVGTGVVNGVPVTEYEGTFSAASGLAGVKANLGSAYSAAEAVRVTAMGLTTVRFRAWLDSQQGLMKLVFIEDGTHANLTVTQTTVSVNQPANIQFPLASETYVVPGTPQA